MWLTYFRVIQSMKPNYPFTSLWLLFTSIQIAPHCIVNYSACVYEFHKVYLRITDYHNVAHLVMEIPGHPSYKWQHWKPIFYDKIIIIMQGVRYMYRVYVDGIFIMFIVYYKIDTYWNSWMTYIV